MSSHCYGDFRAFLAEVRRVLRPAGQFLYADFRPATEVPAWRAALEAAGFSRRAEVDISPAVLAALEADDARKRAIIEAVIDRPLARIFDQFAALRGSELYDELRSRRLAYHVFSLARDGV